MFPVQKKSKEIEREKAENLFLTNPVFDIQDKIHLTSIVLLVNIKKIMYIKVNFPCGNLSKTS